MIISDHHLAPGLTHRDQLKCLSHLVFFFDVNFSRHFMVALILYSLLRLCVVLFSVCHEICDKHWAAEGRGRRRSSWFSRLFSFIDAPSISQREALEQTSILGMENPLDLSARDLCCSSNYALFTLKKFPLFLVAPIQTHAIAS